MKKYIYAILCLFPALLGLVAGGVIAFSIGVTKLPADLGAEVDISFLFSIIQGVFWGAVIGFGVGIVCCLLWHFFVQRRTKPTASETAPEEGEVWPPAPTH